MWLLKNEEKGQIYKVKARENIVSRKDGDLLLSSDLSISRRHAALRVNESGQVILKDLGSKYGTFIKSNKSEFKRATANEEIVLQDADIVRFGSQFNLWTLEYFPIIVTTSTLKQEEKIEIREIISTLGGTVTNNCAAQCTHLVMNEITITVKVVCALAHCRPIVTPEYFRSLLHCITSMQLPLPDVKDFIPKLVEPTLNSNEISFIPNAKRKNLFSGTIFVASTPRQLTRIEMMIVAAGGKVENFLPTKAGVNDYLKEGRLLMMHSALDRQASQESQVPDGYKQITRMLKSQGIRCIPESEVGLSILFCSTKQYCNPRFKAQIISQQEHTQHHKTKEPSKTLVPETQDQIRKISISNIEVPETCSISIDKEQSSSTNNSKKRMRAEHEETTIQKRACKQQNDDEDLFAFPSLQPSTSRQASVRSPDLFSFPSEKDSARSVGISKEHSKSDDLFNFPDKTSHTTKSGLTSSPSINTLKRLNTDVDIFSSIIEKNRRKNNPDGDFIFPSEREENKSKLQGNKRNRNETSSDFDFPELEDKRKKFNNKDKSEQNRKLSFDDNDPFKFPFEVEGKPSPFPTKINKSVKLFDSVDSGPKNYPSSKNKNSEREKMTGNSSSDDEISPPEVNENRKDSSFCLYFDEEIKKEPPKPVMISSFITKPSIKKEVSNDEEEDLTKQFNVTVEIQVKNLVKPSSQEVPSQQNQSNVINFKKFKKKQCGLQHLPCIIGGNELVRHLVM